MELNTERLRIVPLSVYQFKKLLGSMEEMEHTLKLSPSKARLDEHTQRAMEELYKNAVINSDYYMWYTNWQIILKSENVSVGSACFIGEPNETGEVEIGYGTHERYRGHGYMTEAIQAMCQWALSQPNVTCVVAETDKDNIASHTVLKNCGMQAVIEAEQSIWWKLELPPI